jgi:hypothetical protein
MIHKFQLLSLIISYEVVKEQKSMKPYGITTHKTSRRPALCGKKEPYRTEGLVRAVSKGRTGALPLETAGSPGK